jgi:serine/threonine protein kinase
MDNNKGSLHGEHTLDDAKKIKHEHLYSGSSLGKESVRDDEEHLLLRDGDVLGGRFTVHSLMGTGTFGKVYQCEDAKHNDTVAVKVIRKIERYIHSAKTEASILKRLYKAQEDRSWKPVVTMYTHVYHDGHYCMVFEPLGKSLLDYIQLNEYRGFPKYMVKQIAYQLLHALDFLHRHQLVHTDLKLENILFVEGPEMELPVAGKGGVGGSTGSSRSKTGITSAGPVSGGSSSPQRGLRLPKLPHIKLIDFGGAVFDGMHHSRIINTRQYRSPEVILELGWSCPSDVWSAGCIVAEILSGDLLFSTHDDLEHLYMIERVVESFPDHMRSRSPVGRDYFHGGGWDVSKRRSSRGERGGAGGGWRGQSRGPMPLRAELLSAKSKKYSNDLPTLRQFSNFVASSSSPESSLSDPSRDDVCDPDMEEVLFDLLRVDPAERRHPDQVAAHRWFAEVLDSPVHSFDE